jgi:hypothetical protein
VLLHQAQQGTGGTLAERVPDFRLAPFAVRHAHGPVPVGHLTVRIHLTVRYPLGDRTMDRHMRPALSLVPNELDRLEELTGG